MAHIADGWKGQRIAVFPEQKIVLSMTAIMDSGEAAAFSEIVGRFATHLLDARAAGDPTATELAAALKQVGLPASGFGEAAEERMLPSTKAKERHHPLKR